MRSINSLSLGELAEAAGGLLEGDPEIEISGANTIECAGEGDITFLANPKYRKWLESTRAACIVIHRDMELPPGRCAVRTDNPAGSFRKILERLYGSAEHPFSGISRLSSIDNTARLGDDVSVSDFVRIEARAEIGPGTAIYPGCYIGKDTVIGAGCLLYPNVTVMNDVRIGDRVIINSGSVIGGEGFGYSTEDGAHIKIPQVGGVVVYDDVEIGSNVSIDRGSPGDTVIGQGTKIDNLVQIAHNVKIGKFCLLVSQAGIAGSTVVEDYAVLGGQAGVVGHITIGRLAQVGAQAGVTRDVKPHQQVSGYPAMNHASARRINALTRRLPMLFKQVEQLSREHKEK